MGADNNTVNWQTIAYVKKKKQSIYEQFQRSRICTPYTSDYNTYTNQKVYKVPVTVYQSKWRHCEIDITIRFLNHI